MNPTVIPYSEWLAILTALTTTGGGWLAPNCSLFQNNFVPTPSMSLASLTEADFTGYSAVAAVTWATPGYTPAGQAVVTGSLCQYQVGSTPTVFNTIYGYYLTNTAGTALLFARAFQAPVVLSAALQIVEVVPSYVTFIPS